MEDFFGYHSEWNLGSPGGWDYQRTTQIIGREVWLKLNEIRPIGVDLNMDHPVFSPLNGFTEMLIQAHKAQAGNNPGLIAVVAEEETLETVTENRNLADKLSSLEGITGALISPQEIELKESKVSFRGQPISVLFMDFNTDVLLALHLKHNLTPLLQAVKENRVINPRGTEPINIKSMFEVISSNNNNRFHPEIVRRTPWTRQFFPRKTDGPKGEEINDLIEWTRSQWQDLVLKPERGYSGKGVMVGGMDKDAEEAVKLALSHGNYIVQEKIPPHLWAEDIPTLNPESKEITLESYQTDFRSMFGPKGLFGFLSRFGGIPTNVGSGGGVQPLAVLRSDISIKEAIDRINEAILSIGYDNLLEVIEMQKKMSIDHELTYLLGPIKMAVRPRLITSQQLTALERYCAGVWSDCLCLEKMWLRGELDEMIQISEDELEIAHMQPWHGGPAIFASDGLFNFDVMKGL
jgi:hypothetical protein